MAASAPSKARKTTARKPAKARAKTNGHSPLESSAVPTTELPKVPSEAAPAPPERVPELAELPDDQLKHPYGEQRVFIYRPLDGGDPIIFPRISELEITPKFLWSIYELNELYQSFEWMKKAGVPRDIQERVMDLPLKERETFWKNWFRSASGPVIDAGGSAPPGES